MAEWRKLLCTAYLIRPLFPLVHQPARIRPARVVLTLHAHDRRELQTYSGAHRYGDLLPTRRPVYGTEYSTATAQNGCVAIQYGSVGLLLWPHSWNSRLAVFLSGTRGR